MDFYKMGNIHGDDHSELALAPHLLSLFPVRLHRHLIGLFAIPHLNSASLRQPRASLSILDSDLPTHASSAFSINSPFSSFSHSHSLSLFHSQLKTYLFQNTSHHRSSHSFFQSDTTDSGCSPFSAYPVLFWFCMVD